MSAWVQIATPAGEAAPRQVVIVGASGHAKSVAGIAVALGCQVIGYADRDGAISGFRGRPVRPITDWPHDLPIVLGIGNPAVRARVMCDLEAEGRQFATLVHPRAFVDPTAELGPGTVVMPGAIVGVDARVGRGAVINTSASADHDCQIGDFAHLAPGAHLSGDVSVGEGAWIGVGASVVQQVSIGNWTMVGAGAAVISALPDEVTAVGVPAKVIRQGRYCGRLLPGVQPRRESAA
jgi:sugar O-acyltransferase (sialic acid O-acetyltransferase NeuD family)